MALQRLKEEAEKAKIALSSAQFGGVLIFRSSRPTRPARNILMSR